MLCSAVVLVTALPMARAATSEPPLAPPVSPLSPPSASSSLFLELATGFVPVANDVPILLGVGVRIAEIHEFWLRAGYMPVGDDVGHGFAVLGYRAALRPGRVARPVLGGYVAGLPATCGHDPQGNPSCTSAPLFILSATFGLRIEPRRWLGFSALLSLGMDSYPNPFGMIEIATTFSLPPL